MNFPTAEQIRNIATDDTRSLDEEADVIAGEYYRLAHAMAERLGTDDVNWCGFAMWSSKAVGASLRLGRNSPFWDKARIAFGIHWIFTSVFRVVLKALLGRSYGRGLSIANRSIFLEIGTFYANLLTANQRVEMFENKALRNQAFDHPLIGSLTDKQKDHLLQTAELFRDAERATGAERSALILASNAALSAHEQARVQHCLEFVLYRPVRWLTRLSWRLPLSYLTRRSLPRFAIYSEPHAEQPPLTRWLETVWSRGYVRALSLDIPGGEVIVGRPLVRPQSAPSPLLDATFNERVAAIVAKFHPNPGVRLEGVRDWLDYDDRMRFIVSYFMMYQNDPSMLNDPLVGRRPRRRASEIAAACTQWVSRTVRLPRIVDPMADVGVEPEPVELGILTSR